MRFMQIKPQKCRGKFTESLWSDPTWSAENKEDGDRRIAQFMPHHVIFTGTRESVDGTGFVNKSACIPHLAAGRASPYHIKSVKDRDVPGRGPPVTLAGTVLDGEIVAPWAKDLPGGESKQVTAVMGSLPERAVTLQREKGWLRYLVFDCLWFRGEDLRQAPLAHRKHHLFEALKIWKNEYAEQVHAYVKESEKRRAWESAREGLVFKHEDHLYGDERLWVKLKKQATADVVVMGYKSGKGQHAGKVGSIIFGQYHYRCGKLTLDKCGAARGFDFKTMMELTMRGSKYKGKTFRITHNGREPTGKFRHPRFDSWRDDKDPHDCIWYPEET